MKGQEWSQQQLPQGQKAESNQVFFRTKYLIISMGANSGAQLGQKVHAQRWASTQVHAACYSPMTACMASEHLNWHAS